MRNDNLGEQILKLMPYHKMGIKLLEKEQMDNIFPDYKNLLGKIDQHRKKISNIDFNAEMFHDIQYNLMYDNVLSIMGARGSGKTSVIFTLREKIKDKNPNDIVLPIIMSEVIPKDKSVIGWILALLENTVKTLSDQQDDDFQTSQFESCQYGRKYTLMQQYNRVKSMCFSKLSMGGNERSLANEIANMERQNQNGYDFSAELLKLWNYIVEVKKKNQTEIPLIYIIFDDVDLVPEMLDELFSTIVKYLSHPNIIVLVTADEPTLYMVIQKKMREMLGLEEDLNISRSVLGDAYVYTIDMYNGSVLRKMRQRVDACKEMEKLYVDKILPPSSRYYLRSFESNKKKSVFIDKYRWEEEHSRVTIQDCFEEKISELIEMLQLDNDESFLVYDGNFVDTYLLFLGKTSRQLANGCFLVEEFIDSVMEICSEPSEKIKEDKNQFYNRIHEAIGRFTYGILNTHGCYGLDTTEIKSILHNLFQYREGETYFGYIYLKELYMEEVYNQGKRKLETAELIVLLAVLMFFVENIFRRIRAKYNDERVITHGIGILVDILDDITPRGIALVKKDDERNASRFLYIYGALLEDIEVLSNFDLMRHGSVRLYLNHLRISKNIFKGMNLEQYREKHPIWFRTICKILFLTKGGIYDLSKKDLPYGMLSLTEVELLYGREWREMQDALQENTIDVLAERIIDKKIRNSNPEDVADLYEKIYHLVKSIRVNSEKITEYELTDGQLICENMNSLGLDIQCLISADGVPKEHLAAPVVRSLMQRIAVKSIRLVEDDANSAFQKRSYDQLYWLLMRSLKISETEEQKILWNEIKQSMDLFLDAQKQYINAYLDRDENPYKEWMDASDFLFEPLYQELLKVLKNEDGKDSHMATALNRYLRDCMREYLETVGGNQNEKA